MNMLNEFRIGDIVRLKSGGPAMTVTFVSRMISCEWFADTKVVESSKFPPDALQLEKPSGIDSTN
jgi:uncharacterized protein YodC (DUF2158 family)